jgi:ABC-2 type transport system permease protein
LSNENALSAKQGTSGTILGSLGTFYHRRWLVKYFVQRQLTRNYRKSFLGFFWAFLGPLFMVVLLTLVFSEIIGLRFREVEGDSSLNFGLYLYCGLIPFLAYSEALSKGVGSIRASANLVQKVIFPLEFLPFTTAITSLVDKLFGLGALMVVLLLLEHRLNWTVILLPLVVVIQMLFILGLTYLMAIAGTYLPDIGQVLNPIVRATFFATPIIWPADRVPENLRFIVDYNPLAYLVETYRDLILSGELPGAAATLGFSAFALALFVVGFGLFVRVKPRFADLL